MELTVPFLKNTCHFYEIWALFENGILCLSFILVIILTVCFPKKQITFKMLLILFIPQKKEKILFFLVYLPSFLYVQLEISKLSWLIKIIPAYRLIEECWNENPAKRPTFRQIITRLESIYNSLGHKRRWKVRTPSQTIFCVYCYAYFNYCIIPVKSNYGCFSNIKILTFWQ